LFLKASQTLEEVAALGATVIGVNYNDQAAMQSARRKLAKETAALVGTHVQADGDKTRMQIRSSMDEVKGCVRDEIKKLGFGAKNPGGVKRAMSKLVGKKVVAAEPDQEMGDVAFEVCHAEEQTFPDGQKRTVCLIKAEGKPTLSREFSKLSPVPDPFGAGSVDQPVRVLVVSTTGESAGMRFHMGWRGTVTKVNPSGQVRVNFPYLGDGKVLSRQANVPREHLQILTEDDISMTPNQHPWVGQRVTVEQGSGEIVHVNDQGKVKIRIAQGDSKRKKIVFVESRGATFEALFNSNASRAEAPPEAVPKQQATEEETEQNVEPREAISVADSDGESDGGPAPSRLHDSDDEPIASAAKRKKQGAQQMKRAKAPRKRPSAAVAQPSQPKRRVRRKVASSGPDVD
jgi:hypothetical protein